MIEYESLANSNRAFFDEIKEVLNQTVDSGWYILGNRVKEFETQFAEYHHVPFAVGLNSGLDALMLALRSYDFPEGSEIIVPSNTYIATILAIIQCGLKPVLVEPDITTYNIDPKLIATSLTENTRGIMVVHLYGKMCNMDPILELCKNHNLILIEDCAQSHGAKYNNKLSGTFGDYGAFSFYPTKNLGALGDAGAVITSNPEYATKVKALRNYGSHIKYHNEYLGYNSRLQEFQAAILSVKLKHLDEITLYKQRLAAEYQKGLTIEGLVLPVVQQGYEDVFHIYAVRHPERDRLKSYLLENGIKTEIHYPVPPHHQNAMKGILDGQSFPLSEEIHKTVLSLPISFGTTLEEVQTVIQVINRFQ